jgi:3-keto-5-aminohexanoate cleavage enzyme
MEKLIIFVAPGSPDYASDNYPGIPKSWDALVEDAVACREAGASIYHLHGPQESNRRLLPDGWGEVTERIRKASGLLVDFGRAGATPEYRIPLMKLGTGRPDFMAFSLTDHDFHRHADTRPNEAKGGFFDTYFTHTREELVRYAELCLETKIKPTWEIWHLGGVWNFQYLERRGLVEGPHWFNLLFGVDGSAWSPSTIAEIGHRLDHMPEGSRSLVGPRGAPDNQTRMLTYAMLRGAHVRLGCQDVPEYAPGVMAKSNAELVARIVRIARELGREIATPNDVRKMLRLSSS